MLGRAAKKLIIVCDEKTEQYANYIRQLISASDDKPEEIVGVADGTVDAAVWLEKEYLANKAQISSNEHILFVGDNKTSKSESSSMVIKFDKYGMQYGWLGKRAMMKVSNEMLEPEKYDDFLKYALSYEADFERITMKRVKPKPVEKKVKAEKGIEKESENQAIVAKKDEKKSTKSKAQAGTFVAGVGAAAAKGIGAATAGIGFAAALVPVAGASAGLGIAKGINIIQVHKKVKDQQYRALSVILYIDGLQEFLEG